MNQSCSPSLDDTWGPIVNTCRRFFDFTLLFEQAILTILPASCFLLLALWTSSRLWGRRSRAQFDELCIAKLGVVAIEAILQLALIGLWARDGDGDGTRLAVAASAVTFASLISLAFLSFLEHIKTIKPSFLIGWYLLLSSLLDLAQTRTLWLTGQDKAIAAVFTSYFALKILLLIVESLQKNLLSERDSSRSPEDRCNVISRSFFLWVLPLMVRGFRQPLKLGDLYPPPKEAEPQSLEEKMSKLWDQGKTLQFLSLSLPPRCFQGTPH